MRLPPGLTAPPKPPAGEGWVTPAPPPFLTFLDPPLAGVHTWVIEGDLPSIDNGGGTIAKMNLFVLQGPTLFQTYNEN